MNFLKNFSYSFSANFINLFIRTSYVFILPKIISVESFGYWQLYFLYTQFMHFCHLGLVDGIYLKIGGKFYDDLDKDKLRPQMAILFLLALAFSVIIALNVIFFVSDANKIYILLIVAIDLLLMLPRTLLSVIFQATGMIKQFSLSVLSEAVISFIIVGIMLVSGVRNFFYIILADTIGRLSSLCISLYFSPGMCAFDWPTKQDFIEAINNVKIGAFLLMSNMAGMLILAIVRLVIEQKWGIVTFSKISLSFSIANMAMVAITAASVVLFPMLKRMDHTEFKQLYTALKSTVVVILMVCLCLYYPMVKVLSMWIPEYVESLRYLGIIAPMCLYEAQLILVSYNYFKAARKERTIFLINVVAVVLSIVISGTTMIGNIDVEVLLCLVLVLELFKLGFADYLLNNLLRVKDCTSLKITTITTVVFIISNSYFSNLEGLLTYTLSAIVLILSHRKDILKNIDAICKTRNI